MNLGHKRMIVSRLKGSVKLVIKTAAGIPMALLFDERIRNAICRIRWRLLQKNLKLLEGTEITSAVGRQTIDHNLGALKAAQAVFGMAGRMSLLLYPIAAVLKDRLATSRILIVGPRTEDDIFWAKSLGLRHTEGIDLFSYSKHIKLGDIHNSGLPSEFYDAVLLGWMISYSSDPERVVQECKRMLKPGGYLGIGIEANPQMGVLLDTDLRKNSLNCPADLIELVKSPVLFSNERYDPGARESYDCGVVFKVLKEPR
jgi:SAM-dependent methyltransferase